MDLMSLLTGFDNRFAGGRAANDPMALAAAQDYTKSLRQQMADTELARWGMNQQPQVDIDSMLRPQSNWQDSTGLGGRMAQLASLPAAAAPAGPTSPGPGLLAEALRLAAQQSGGLSPNQVTNRTGSGTYRGDILESSGPLQSQPWYDEYLAASRAGEAVPLVRGNAQENPEMLARRQAFGQQMDADRAGRQRNVQSNAVAKRVARHERMGIPDQGIMFDNLERLQGMQGQGGGDPTSALGYLMNSLVGGGQYAQGAMEGTFANARQAASTALEKAKLQMAPGLAAIASGNLPPDQIQAILGSMGGNTQSMAPAPIAPPPSQGSPGAPLANAHSDPGLAQLWGQRANWQPEQFISAAQAYGYTPADVIPFLESRGVGNPRAPGLGTTMGPQDLPLFGIFDPGGFYGAGFGPTLSDLMTKFNTSNNPPLAKLPARFQGQLP